MWVTDIHRMTLAGRWRYARALLFESIISDQYSHQGLSRGKRINGNKPKSRENYRNGAGSGYFDARIAFLVTIKW